MAWRAGALGVKMTGMAGGRGDGVARGGGISGGAWRRRHREQACAAPLRQLLQRRAKRRGWLCHICHWRSGEIGKSSNRRAASAASRHIKTRSTRRQAAETWERAAFDV